MKPVYYVLRLMCSAAGWGEIEKDREGSSSLPFLALFPGQTRDPLVVLPGTAVPEYSITSKYEVIIRNS